MVQPHYHPCSGDCPNGLLAGSLIPRDRGICGARIEAEGIMRAATCTLLAEHSGWHQDDYGMSWTPTEDQERIEKEERRG